MKNKYKIILNYIKDLSIEIPNPETLIIARENIPNYIMHVDITPKALKNKMIDVATKLTYKDKNEKWLSPDQINKTKEGLISKIDGSKVKVGPSEAMSKSKKNIVDPESMIQIYGADAVRWFILSDSPPERDVQWSTEGVSAAHKFIQRIWNLNNKIISHKLKNSDSNNEKKFLAKFNKE